MKQERERVSVVICVKNGADFIENSILSVLGEKPFEVITVDGESTDDTLRILQRFDSVRIFSDHGRGLSYARRLGVEKSSGDYVIFIGPDNKIEEGFIAKFVCLLNKGGWDAGSVQTRVLKPKNFWDRGLDFRWRCLMKAPGQIDVAGTPSLYRRRVFDALNFTEEELGPNDDTELALRMSEKGLKIGLVPLLAYDQNQTTALGTWSRFKWYGEGDFYFYKKNHSGWTIKRRLRSIFHPLRQTISFSVRAIIENEWQAIAWLGYTCIARYFGWVSKIIKKGK